MPARWGPARAARFPAECGLWHRGRTAAGPHPHRAERDFVEERPAVYVRYVDPSLDAVTERIQRARQVLPVHPHVEREVVARPGGNAYEREAARCCDRGHDRQRPIAAGHAEGICAASCCCLGERCRLWPGPRTTTSIPCWRARSTSPPRSAAPPPNLRFTNSTGCRRRPAACQPQRNRCCPVPSRGDAGCSDDRIGLSPPCVPEPQACRRVDRFMAAAGR